MTIADLTKKGWTKPEHMIYVVEAIRLQGLSYSDAKDLVTAWARRVNLVLEPWMVTEAKLVAPKGVS